MKLIKYPLPNTILPSLDNNDSIKLDDRVQRYLISRFSKFQQLYIDLHRYTLIHTPTRN